MLQKMRKVIKELKGSPYFLNIIVIEEYALLCCCLWILRDNDFAYSTKICSWLVFVILSIIFERSIIYRNANRQCQNVNIQCLRAYKIENIKELSSDYPCGNISNGSITWRVNKVLETPFYPEVELCYEKFKNGEKFDQFEHELIDFDEFCIESLSILARFFEKHGLKPMVNITDKVLPTVTSNKTLMFQILSAIAMECVNISDNGSEVLCSIDRKDSKITITIKCKSVRSGKMNINLEKENNFSLILKALKCNMLTEMIGKQAYFILEI